uniref:Ovule protein n=1 Tax=Ascaris lumbricoides TaxID=6252 RepID=A0A0M3IRD6_ASCLU
MFYPLHCPMPSSSIHPLEPGGRSSGNLSSSNEPTGSDILREGSDIFLCSLYNFLFRFVSSA